MHYTYLQTLNKAIKFCIDHHGDQKRKYTGEPYWHHPMEVSNILNEHGYSELDVQCAAILHDVVEDTDATIEDVLKEFGRDICELVNMVTDVSKSEDGNRNYRKALDREHLRVASYFGQVIKLADIISNTKDIVKHDPKFAKTYMAEKAKLLTVLTKPLEEPNGVRLYKKACEAVANYYAMEAEENE